MKTSEKGLHFIKEEEGCELVAYRCPAGVLTIGIGHTSAAGAPKVYDGMRITMREAEEILKSDLRKFEADINRLVKVPLNQSQFDALVSFVFNIGTPAFAKSTMLRKLNAGDYDGAAGQFHVWNKANKKVIKGLVNRRAREAALFVEDEWQADNKPTPQGNISRDVPPIVTKENVSFASGIASTVAVPMASDSPPIQYALALIMVVGFCVGLFFFLKRRGA